MVGKRKAEMVTQRSWDNMQILEGANEGRSNRKMALGRIVGVRGTRMTTRSLDAYTVYIGETVPKEHTLYVLGVQVM